MIEGKPSQTALMVAVMRAHHNAFSAEPKIIHDSLAMSLSGIPNEEVLDAQ
jgi:O-methyltransferase involved in polyketide biosynthesis